MLQAISARNVDLLFYEFMEKYILKAQDIIVNRIPKDLPKSKSYGLEHSIKKDLITPILMDIKSRSVTKPDFFPMIRQVIKRNSKNIKQWSKYKLPFLLKSSKLHKRTFNTFSAANEHLPNNQQVSGWHPGNFVELNTNAESLPDDVFSHWDDSARATWQDLHRLVDGSEGQVSNVVEVAIENVAPANNIARPNYYYNLAKSYAYGFGVDLHSWIHGHIKEVGKSLSEGATEDVVERLFGEQFQQAIQDAVEKLHENMPIAAKELSNMRVDELQQVLTDTIHNSGKAATTGAMDALKIGDSHFHVEAGKSTGAAFVRGIVGQSLKYGGMLAVIVCIPLILVLASVRFFENHFYEANDYPSE